MALDDTHSIDAVGTEASTGVVVLTLLDAWDWADERAHLFALQAKLNAYFEFVESGQLEESYPEARDRPRKLEIVTKHALAAAGQKLLDQAAIISLDGLRMDVVTRHHP